MTVDRDEFQAPPPPRPRTFLEELSLDLTHLAALLAEHAERDAARRAARGGPVSARQVAALIAARRARSAVFGCDLAKRGHAIACPLGTVR